MSDIQMWEILVPTVRNDGRPIRTRFHRVWDLKVREISGGLTIMAPSKGQWKSQSGEWFLERMIPVRILATKDQIGHIIDLTLEYYKQEAVLCYAISDNVIMKLKDEKAKSPAKKTESEKAAGQWNRLCLDCHNPMKHLANIDNKRIYICTYCDGAKPMF